MKTIFKVMIGVVLAFGLLIAGCSALLVVASENDDAAQSPAAETTSADAPPETSEAETEEEPEETAGQANARESAEAYLATAAFSRKGLIEQLRFEGYTRADAIYAVEAVSPNWSEQAAKAAQSYLDTSAFSRSGLIEQLVFEGYTRAQGEYGVSKTGLGSAGEQSGETAGQQNARESAKSYLATGAFSREGLIQQLTFEGYAKKDAVYAVNAIKPNWNQQAAKAARSYLDTSSFSRTGLIEQLMFEGYTRAQAEYGVDKTGL